MFKPVSFFTNTLKRGIFYAVKILKTFRVGQKIRIRRTEMNMIRESSTEPQPKLVRYANMFKILVSKEPEPNPIRTKIFRVRFIYPNISELDLYT